MFTELAVIPIYSKTDTERVELRISRDVYFRYYLRFGKAYLDNFDGEGVWRPTAEGATLPLTIDTAQKLMLALCSLLDFAEAKGLIDAGFKQTIRDWQVSNT